VLRNTIVRAFYWDPTNNNDADYMYLWGDGNLVAWNYCGKTTDAEITATNATKAHVDGVQTFDDPSGGFYVKNFSVLSNIFEQVHEGMIMEQQFMHWHQTGGKSYICWNVIANGITNSPDGSHPFGVEPIINHGFGNLVITNNTITNMTYSISCSTAEDTDISYMTNIVIKNNIIAPTSSSEVIIDAGLTVDVDYNLCRNVTLVGAHSISADPLFTLGAANVLGIDNLPFTTDDGLRLLVGSPAIGAGLGGVDIGAYPFSVGGGPPFSGPAIWTTGNSTQGIGAR
jgi:hypothetical protein